MYWIRWVDKYGHSTKNVSAFLTKQQRDWFAEDFPQAIPCTRSEAIKAAGLKEVQKFKPVPEWEYTRD